MISVTIGSRREDGHGASDNLFLTNDFSFAPTNGMEAMFSTIAANHFDGDGTALRLWADSIAPSDWGYRKHRDKPSRDYLVRDNRLVASARCSM